MIKFGSCGKVGMGRFPGGDFRIYLGITFGHFGNRGGFHKKVEVLARLLGLELGLGLMQNSDAEFLCSNFL